jgi:hypothetical protein
VYRRSITWCRALEAGRPYGVKPSTRTLRVAPIVEGKVGHGGCSQFGLTAADPDRRGPIGTRGSKKRGGSRALNVSPEEGRSVRIR